MPIKTSQNRLTLQADAGQDVDVNFRVESRWNKTTRTTERLKKKKKMQ